jgi:hypothetical protein
MNIIEEIERLKKQLERDQNSYDEEFYPEYYLERILEILKELVSTR